MKIEYVHDFNLKTESDFKLIQDVLLKEVNLTNNFDIDSIETIAGVDLAYWDKKDGQYGVCCIVVIDYKTKKVLKKINSFGKVNVPYIAGYLAFRELPLFLDCVKKLSYEPDMFFFDGNGYLHYNHLGIATHASFFINKPTIGVAKSYLKIENTDFIMPENKLFSYTDIVIDNEVYGRAIRTKKDVKPIFISCGNFIDLETSTKIVCEMIGKESRIPIPTRIADIETHNYRKEFKEILI